MALDAEEAAMLEGRHGEATQIAMRILTRVAPLYGATKLQTVTRAHIDDKR